MPPLPSGVTEWFVAAAAFLGALAAIVTSITVIWSRAIGPYMAKPIAKAIRHELTEAVELIFADSDVVHQHIREVTQEAVAAEVKIITKVLGEQEHRIGRSEDRLSRIEAQLMHIGRDTSFVADRMAERPPRTE